jgi:hypothetical protein
MTTPPNDPAEIAARLRTKLQEGWQKTHDRFSALSETGWSTVIFADSGWTSADLLRHLISAEAAMHGLIENIRHGGEGSSEEFDLNRWNQRQVGKMQGVESAELLARLQATHHATLALLATITPAEWAIPGRHPGVGQTDIAGIFRVIALHQQLHLADLARST